MKKDRRQEKDKMKKDRKQIIMNLIVVVFAQCKTREIILINIFKKNIQKNWELPVLIILIDLI